MTTESALTVHPRLRTIELRRAILLVLAGLIIGGGLGMFSLWRAWLGVHTAWLYPRAVPAAEAQMVRMSSTRQLIAQVHATVSYLDSQGRMHVHEVRLLRLLVTPEPKDAIEVRYLKDEPEVAVSSWERDSVPHELAVALCSALLVALVAAGVIREVRGSVARLALTAELAKDGKLSVVDLLDCKKDDKGFRVMLRYRFRTPSGVVLQGDIASSEGGAYRLAESEHQSLALLARDERTGLLLTRSGYPLLNAAEVHAAAARRRTTGRPPPG